MAEPDLPVGGPAADLIARLEVARDRFVVDVALTVPAGSVTTLLGPNGAGKSTVLRALAGLVPLRSGRMQLGDQVLADTAARLQLPAERRPVGYVFQDQLLFPHLSARDNIAFGLRARGIDRRTARRRADALLVDCGISEIADRRPAAMSGGQAQRVALARALAIRPALLLLDEPLSALDVGARAAMRAELRRHVASYDGATVLVTHDPLDALTLADDVAVIEEGRIVQSGSPADIARRPRTDYVARLMGVNLLGGHSDGRCVDLADGGRLTVTGAAAGDVYVAVRPTAVTLFASAPSGTSTRNVWPGVVGELESRGDVVRVGVEGQPSVTVDVTTAAVAELRLHPGTAVWCAVKATDLEVYPR